MPSGVTASSRHAFDILKLIGRADRPVPMKEIVARLNMPASTVWRAVATLEHAGFLSRHGSGATFVLGEAVRQLRRAVFARFPVRDVSLPFMQQLSYMTGETVSLTVPIGWYAVLIATVVGTKEIVDTRPLGEVARLDRRLGGRAILAGNPAKEQARFFDWLRRYDTGAGPVPHNELPLVHSRGYVVEPVSYNEQRAAASFPIRLQGRSIAAVTIEGAVLDVGADSADSEMERWLDAIRGIEEAIGRQPTLGFNPYAHLDPAIVALAETD